MHKLLWDFKIQTDHLISARRPDIVIINKKKRTYRNVDFAVPIDHRVKLKMKRRINTSTLLVELKKMEHDVTIIPIVIVALGTVTKRINEGTGGLGN